MPLLLWGGHLQTDRNSSLGNLISMTQRPWNKGRRSPHCQRWQNREKRHACNRPIHALYNSLRIVGWSVFWTLGQESVNESNSIKSPRKTLSLDETEKLRQQSNCIRSYNNSSLVGYLAAGLTVSRKAGNEGPTGCVSQICSLILLSPDAESDDRDKSRVATLCQ